jgi:trimethylamine:corrinoid methyltransferase-like protein
MPITAPARDGERSGPAAITPGAGRWNRMSADGCAQLQAAACAILERTGVRVDHPEARRLLAAAGARVDAADRVRIPAALVAEALAVAPKALESGLAGSLPQLAICDELVGWTRAATAPLDLSAEALALDLVDAVGPEGSFLEADHTLAHYRSRWYPSLFDRRSRGAGAAAGGQALGARAADRVDAILAGHAVPPPLPEAASTELREIVARAEARAGL